MRKVYLFQVTQHNLKRYVGKADPRDLVRLATKVEMKVEQEAQRPVNPKRLEEIATFVFEKLKQCMPPLKSCHRLQQMVLMRCLGNKMV